MTSPKSRPLGARIRDLRTERGLTMSKLAGDALTEAYISLIESGKRQPSEKALGHIANVLGVDPEELRTGKSRRLELDHEIELQQARRDIDRGAGDEAGKLLVRVKRDAERNGQARTAAKAQELIALLSERSEGAEVALPKYEKAEGLWRDEPLHLRFGAVIGIARCTHHKGNPQLALHILDAYRRDLERSDNPDPLALMQTYTAMVYPAFSAGVPEKAAEVARAALTLEGRVEEPEQVACMNLTVARSLLFSGDYGEALASIRKAEQIYLAGGWRNQVAKTQIAEAIVLSKKEDFEPARDTLLRALELLRESPHPLDEALALNELGHVSRHLDDIHGALSYLERARTLLEDRHVTEKAFNERELGLCLAGSDAKIAERHLKKATDLYRIQGATQELATTFKELGRFYAARGEIDKALQAFEEGLAAVEERSA